MAQVFLLPLLLVMMTIDSSLYALSVRYNNESYDAVGYDNCNMMTNGEIAVIKNFIHDNDLVFDVGANKGEWSMAVAKNKSVAMICAFEPITNTFNQLEKNLQQYSAIAYNYAVCNSTGKQDIYFFTKNSELTSLYNRPILYGILKQEPITVEVETYRLDDFCGELAIDHINFLKIDTEGAEVEVLKSCETLINKKAIDYIQFEYGGCYQDSNTTLFEVYHSLRSNGYFIYRILPDKLLYIHKWAPSLECYKYSNYLAARSPIINYIGL